MFWTGHQRDSSSVLAEQKANTPAKMDSLLRMREHAIQLQKLSSNGGFSISASSAAFSMKSWRLKRSCPARLPRAKSMNGTACAMEAGAEGGKLCGAGGGGFLLVFSQTGKASSGCAGITLSNAGTDRAGSARLSGLLAVSSAMSSKCSMAQRSTSAQNALNMTLELLNS